MGAVYIISHSTMNYLLIGKIRNKQETRDAGLKIVIISYT